MCFEAAQLMGDPIHFFEFIFISVSFQDRSLSSPKSSAQNHTAHAARYESGRNFSRVPIIPQYLVYGQAGDTSKIRWDLHISD